MLKLIAAAAVAAVSLTAGAALAQEPAKTATTDKGPALVDAKGMTLYIFDRDAGGKSACNGPCATNWPPLMAAADAKATGSWTIQPGTGTPLSLIFVTQVTKTSLPCATCCIARSTG